MWLTALLAAGLASCSPATPGIDEARDCAELAAANIDAANVFAGGPDQAWVPVLERLEQRHVELSCDFEIFDPFSLRSSR